VRLFVGNLPYDTTEAELRDHLSAVGLLSSVYLPINKETGKPRGFAFVEFGEDSQAQEAIRRFNNQPFKGRNLSISEARAREARPMGGDMRPRPPMGRPPMGGGPGGPPRPFTPRFDRPAPGEPFTPGGGARKTGRPERPERPEAPRRKARKPGGEAGFRGERGPKRPIREKPGGRLYEGFEDNTDVEVEDLLEDDFARSADDVGEEEILDVSEEELLDVSEEES